MEFHRRGRFSGVNAKETSYGNLENNVDDNRITSDTKSLIFPERSMFQSDLGENQPPNKRAQISNPPFPDLMASKEEEQVGSFYMGEVNVEAPDPTIRQHNEDRMSEAICLLPGFGSKMNSNGSNLKTRLCNKWELTRWCPFGEKCHFAHGSEELRGYDGQLLKKETGNSFVGDVKQTTLPTKANDIVRAVRSNRTAVIPLRNGVPEEMPTRRWKGPAKISKIYGDWIDDFE